MLYLFDADETLIAVLPQSGFMSPVHREVLNGENTFQFSFPADREEAQYIQEGNLVGFKDLDASWQIFEIKKIIDEHGDSLSRTAYCEHIFYELIDDIVTDKRPSSTAISALVGMLENTRWQVGIVDDLGISSTTAYYVSALEAAQAVATAWKGELQWRCIVTGGVIQRYVDLRAARGSDTGKQFAYSKDILSITRTVDASNVYTAMYGRGKGVETESGGYGRRLTFEDVAWTTPANPVNKAAGQEWVGDPEALARWGRPGGRHRFGIYTNEDQTDAAALLQETWDALQEQKTPLVTYKLDVVALETLTEYSHEAVRLGDLVRVIDREFRPELVVSARVVEIERDLKAPENTKIILGNFYPTIVQTTINTQQQIKEVKNKTYNTSWLDGKISVLQNEIENVSSYVFQTPGDGILIMDAPDFATATKAMKMGGGIFALANSKSGDQWNWRTFGDGAGFSADEMNAGILNAALVHIVSAGGKLQIDGDGIRIYDAENNLRINLGQDALNDFIAEIVGGALYSTTVQTGEKGENRGIIKIDRKFLPEYPGYSWGNIIFNNQHGNTQMEISSEGNQPQIYFYDNGTPIGEIRARTLLDTKDMLLRNEKGIDLRSEIGGSITIGKTNEVTSNNGIRAYSSDRVVLESPNVVSLYGRGAGSKAQVNGAEVVIGGNNVYITGATEVTGNLRVLGTVHATGDLEADGSKPAIIPTANYGRIRQYATESPEIILFDRGRARLENGKATVYIDTIHLECIEPDTDLTPWTFKTEVYGEGEDIRVIEWGENYFKVKESNGGESNRSFGWWFYATRKNYAGIRLMEVID
jgi:phage minor structural protein